MERIPFGAPVAAAPLSIAGGEASWTDIFAAENRRAQLSDLTVSAELSLVQAIDARGRAMKAVGITPPDSPLLAKDPLAFTRTPGAGAFGVFAEPEEDRTDRFAAYQDRLWQLAAEFPQHAGIIRAGVPLKQDAEALARQSDARSAELMASHPGWDKYVAAFAGGGLASLRDPVVLGTLFAGGGAGDAASLVGRLLQIAAREALINAGTTAAMQPAIQAWREEAGLPHGFDEAARNVLSAGAVGGAFGIFGGGIHELVRVLAGVRRALPAEARGALDAHELATGTQELRPDGVSQSTYDRRVMYADIEAQRREVPAAPAEIVDEVAVNRIVNALAPAPESVTGRLEPRTDAAIADLVETLRNPGRASLAVPTPVLDHIRALGGVDPKSAIADELRAAGVTARSIYRKGGLEALDNLPHEELPAAVRHEIGDDGNGYALEDSLVQRAGAEAQGHGAGQTVDDLAAVRDYYERQGVDFNAPLEEVRARIREVDDADGRYDAANGANGLSTDEVVAVPEGLSRRQHTEQLVRAVLRQQPGLPGPLVREAVNLSLFEQVPIEEAVSDVMSDAAGVPREAAAIAKPAVTLGDGDIDPHQLGSDPPQLEDLPIDGAEGEAAKVDFEAERLALDELGFGSDVKLPIGDELVSLDELQARLDEAAWEAKVVERCKA